MTKPFNQSKVRLPINLIGGEETEMTDREYFSRSKHLKPEEMRARLVRSAAGFLFDGEPVRWEAINCLRTGHDLLLHGFSSPERPLRVVLLEDDVSRRTEAREAIESVGHELVGGAGDVAAFFDFVNHRCSFGFEAIDLVLTSAVLPCSPKPEMRLWFKEGDEVAAGQTTCLRVVLWALLHRIPIGVIVQSDDWRQHRSLCEALEAYYSQDHSYGHVLTYEHGRSIVCLTDQGPASWAKALLYIEKYALIRWRALQERARQRQQGGQGNG